MWIIFHMYVDMYRSLEISEDSHTNGTNFLNKLWHNFVGQHFQVDSARLLMVIVFCNFCTGSYDTLYESYFPQQNGIQEEYIGIILSSVNMGYIIGCFLANKLVICYEFRNIISKSLAITGFCTLIFGCFQWCHNLAIFITCGTMLRLLSGICMGILNTTCLILISNEFSANLPKIFAISQSSDGIGMILGPVIGGLSSEFGSHIGLAFSLPNLLLGLIFLVNSYLSHRFVGTQSASNSDEHVTMYQLVKKVPILLNMILVSNIGVMLGFNATTLDLHLSKTFQLSSSSIGVIFFTCSVSFVIFNQVFGQLTHKGYNSYTMIIIGCTLCMVSFAITGPIPMFKFHPKVIIVLVAQVLLGIGTSAIMVTSVVQSFAELQKLNENQSSTIALSALLSSSESFGISSWSLLGAGLIKWLGYRWSTAPVVVSQFVLILLTAIAMFNQ